MMGYLVKKNVSYCEEATARGSDDNDDTLSRNKD